MPSFAGKNAAAIWQLAAGLEMGHRPAICTSPREIVADSDGAGELLAGQRAFHPLAFAPFENWKDFQSFARSAVGQDLLPIVQIVDELGTDYLRALAQRMTPVHEADYVISTVHQAKGLEWKASQPRERFSLHAR
ncbi:hypothetical protein [Caballeronia catudaia]|uniref:hypothetical protein n=1 Tax=Caballeronia catudaia TaxID=1777136 RepID=UPI000A88A545|nr:hypothetical protein [Caballeronia catudaia]